MAFNIKEEDFKLRDATRTQLLKNPEQSKWYLVRDLLSIPRNEFKEFYELHSDLGNEHLERVLTNLERLRPENIDMMFYNVPEKSYGDVVDIFERINLGVRVKASQIAVGKLSLYYRGIVEELEKYLEKMRVQHSNRFDLDLFISIFNVQVTGRVDLDELEDDYLKEKIKPLDTTKAAKTIAKDVKAAKRGLNEALKFVDDYLYIDTMKYIPSERTLTCLAYLFSTRRKYMEKKANLHKIALWTAWCLLTNRHNDKRRMAKDVQLIRDNKSQIAEKLFDNLKQMQKKWDWTIGDKIDELKEDEWNINRRDVLFSFLYAIIRWKKAASFPTTDFLIGTKLATDYTDDEEEPDTPDNGDRAPEKRKKYIQVHHIYPLARLKDEGVGKEERNDIGNLTFLLKEDNQQWSDAHISYLDRIDARIKEAHLIHGTRKYKEGQYDKFLKDRRKLIHSALKEFVGELKKKAEFGA